MFIIVGIFSNFIIGKLCDEVSTRKLTIAGLILTAIFYLGISFKLSFLPYLLLFILGGLGHGLFVESMNTFNLKIINHHKGKKLGYTSASGSISAAFGVVSGGILFQYFSFSSVFRTVGFVFLLLLGLVLFLPETKKCKIETKIYLKGMLNKKILLFILVIVLFALHHGAESTSYSLLLKQNFDLNMLQMGFFMGIPIVFLGITSIFLGKKYDKRIIKHESIIYSALILSGIGFILFAMIQNTHLSFIFRVIHEIGDGAFILYLFLGVFNNFSKKAVGGSMGVITTLKITSAAIAAFIFGPIGKSFGYQWPHYTAGIAMLLCIPLLMGINRKIR